VLESLEFLILRAMLDLFFILICRIIFIYIDIHQLKYRLHKPKSQYRKSSCNCLSILFGKNCYEAFRYACL